MTLPPNTGALSTKTVQVNFSPTRFLVALLVASHRSSLVLLSQRLRPILGDLSYNEYKYVFGGFAATDAGVIIAAFDADSNGILEGAELTNWKSTVQQMIAQWGWNPSQETTNCLINAWSSADRKYFSVFGDYHPTITQLEVQAKTILFQKTATSLMHQDTKLPSSPSVHGTACFNKSTCTQNKFEKQQITNRHFTVF